METHLQTLARAQAELGAEVRVICVNHEKASGTVEEWDGPVRVTRVARRMSLSGLDVCPGLMPVLWGLAREAPDLLHLHTPNPTMLLPLVLWARKVPLVVTHQSDIIRQKLLRHLHDPFERLVYGRAAAVLASSPAFIEGSAVLQRYAAKVHLLPLGLDLKPFQEPTAAVQRVAAELRDKYGSPLWLCVGRLIYYKGLDTALKAARVGAGHTPGHRQRPAGEVVARARPTNRRSRSRGVVWPRRHRRVGRRVPSGDGPLVPERRQERVVRFGAGGGDGQRVPRDQYGDTGQRRGMG